MGTDNLGLRDTEANPQPNGIAYIVVPSNIDRDLYIQSVYKNKAVMVRTEDGNLIRNVGVTKDVLLKLRFPVDSTGFGSLVVFLNTKQGRRIIVGIIDLLGEASKILSENQYVIEEKSDTSSVSTLWDADNNELNISVSANDTDIVSRINMLVTNPDKNAEFNLEVSGNILVTAENTLRVMGNKTIEVRVEDEDANTIFSFKYVRGTGLNMIDEFQNTFTTNKDIVQLYNNAGNKFIEMNKDGLSFGSAGGSNEPAVLGNTLDKLIKQFIQIVQQLIIPSPVGPLMISPGDITKLTKLSDQIDTILSKVSTLD